MGEQIFRGIRSDEILDCGCKLKRYISGLNVIDPEDYNLQCTILQHKRFKEYQCRVCGEKFKGQRPLKKHRWSHTI